MKKLTVLFMGILMLGLFACEKENVGEMGAEGQLRKAPPPCATAFLISGMTPATATCSVTDLSTGMGVVTFDNGTAYPTLVTGRDYFIDIQGPTAATLQWCSCGGNSGSTVIQSGDFFILTTSNNGAPYTTCSF